MLCFPDFTENSNNNEKLLWKFGKLMLTNYVQSGVCVSVSLNETWKAAFGCRDPV